VTAQIPIGGRLTGLFRGARLRARSLRATVLVMGGFGAQKAIQLGSNLILTRILFPEAFGLMALITVFLTGLSLISDVGIQASLVRSQRSDDPNFQATAWTLQVVRGLWITGLAWLLAWPFSWLYDVPQLFPLICLSSVSAAVAGFKSVQMAMQQRQLILGRVVTLQVVSQVVSISFTILLAWWMQSVWGLAIGTVVAALVQTGLSHILLPSRNHRFRWNREVLAEIVRFGRWILLATLFTFLGGKGIEAIQGYLTDLETLA
jgi:O-antigen/teichoic acid export membrane protein